MLSITCYHREGDQVQRKPERVGPGQYDPYAHTDIAATARASYSRPAKEGKGNFGSNDVARASVGLLLTPVKDVGDPGAYSPEANKGIAATARSFFGRSNLAGVGGFGAVSRRIFGWRALCPWQWSTWLQGRCHARSSCI